MTAMSAVNGYVNGKNIVLSENIDLINGEEVIVLLKRPPENLVSPKRKHTTEEYRETIRRMGLQAFENGLSEMTMEEINEEIRKARYGKGE